MPIVPRVSVRVGLVLAILATILVSWILSTGIANYFNYLSFRSLRQEMIHRPELYPQPIPEPKFGITEFLTGRPPYPRGAFRPPPEPGMPPRRPMRPFESRNLTVRLVVALAVAGLAGLWLSRKFTNPLTTLARGAHTFRSGDFSHRIPLGGTNEFAAVADAMNQMAERVSDQINRLETEAERRRQLLADIAHELRAPVTTMRTMAGALQDGVADEPERRDRAVASLVETSERMLRLVQDLMDLAKLDLDELPLDLREVDVRELVISAIRSHEADASSAGIALHPVPHSPPVMLAVDPDRIAQILDNLLQNAVCYAGLGAEVSTVVEDGDRVRIVISDTGKGIRAEDLPYVFDSFYRADSARTPGQSHSGLGLSIARRLAQAHGGNLTIWSEEGKGTAVTIELPRLVPHVAP